jgi:DNA-binding transcriptional MocR family regulator
MQGYIKLWRKLQTQSYYGKPNYVALWIHILLSANHKQANIIWNNEKMTINPGQFITGRKELAKATGVSETTVERILKCLESGHQIGQQKTNKWRLISVLNWDKYQCDGHKNGQQKDNKKTTNGQPADTNNNDNNEKNEKNLDTNVSSEPSSLTPNNWNDVKKIFKKNETL